MKEAATLIEYGVPIDPQAMVTPPDVTELELEQGHPGLGDEEYVRRRKELFALCRKHRLENLGPPLIDYTTEETRIWREVTPKLDELHRLYACSMYLKAKRELAITQDEIPQLRHLSDHLRRETNMHLVPAEGALPYRTFYEYIAQRGFPVTQFIRHGSHPEFTPEPDMIHDCLGHVPPLMNRDYAELLTLIGKAVAATTDGQQVLHLKRFSWFSIEFGLIEEAGATKVFGAGILSSTGEIPYSLLSPEVTRRPFVTDVVINTDYDPSRMQDHLFIAPSLPFLRRELEALVLRFGIPVLPLRTFREDRRFAQAMGENSAWFRNHDAEILRQHPEWFGKDLVICCRTPSKIVAVGDDRREAIDEGMKFPEVVELAEREGIDPGSLVTAVVLGDVY